MCRSQTITYSCSHDIRFNISTCNGTYTHWSRKQRERRASCKGSPYLTRKSEAVCGHCARAAREKVLNDGFEKLRNSLCDPDDWAAEMPEEIIIAEAKNQEELYRLHKQFPDGTFKRATRSEKGAMSTGKPKRKSLLSTEVLPEDVVVKFEVNKYATSAGWDNWGENYVKLEDECAENIAVQEAAGITVNWSPWAGQEDGEHEEYEEQLGIGSGTAKALVRDESEAAVDGAVTMESEDVPYTNEEMIVSADGVRSPTGQISCREPDAAGSFVVTPKEEMYPESMFSKLGVFCDGCKATRKAPKASVSTRDTLLPTTNEPSRRRQSAPSKENERPRNISGDAPHREQKPHLVRKKEACDDLRSLNDCNTLGKDFTVST